MQLFEQLTVKNLNIIFIGKSSNKDCHIHCSLTYLVWILFSKGMTLIEVLRKSLKHLRVLDVSKYMTSLKKICHSDR